MATRRTTATLLAGALGLALLSGCGGDGSSSQPAAGSTQETVTQVTIARSPALTQFPLFVAEAKGMWAEHGIEAAFVSIASGPEQTAAQLSGQLDITDNVPNNMLPVVEKGADLVAFGKALPASQFDLIVDADVALPPGGDWKSVMQDLEGKRVGVIARGTGAEDIARTLFKEAGVDPDAQTYIATGLPATTLAAMEGGTIDMAITLEPGIALAVKSGLAVAPFSIRAGDGPDSLQWPGVVATASREYATQNPDVLRRYLDTVNDALAFIKDEGNREEVESLLRSKLSVPADVATYLYDNNLDNFPDTAELTEEDREQLSKAGTWVKSLGKTSRAYEADDFVVTPPAS